MIITIYDVEENKMVKAVVQQCNKRSIIDTVFELIETQHAYRIKISDLKNPSKYIVSSEDLVDLVLYIDKAYNEIYEVGNKK